MATQASIDRVRERISDYGAPPAWDDTEIGARLDECDGSVPRAALSFALALQAEAAGRTDYTVGSTSEKVSQAFDQLGVLVEQLQSEVAALDAAAAAGARAQATGSVAVPVQVVF
jgi:hypothetical protein